MTESAKSGDSEALLRAEVMRLNKVVKALMNRAERALTGEPSDFGHFQTTLVLEGQVRARTRELEAALRENEKINRYLAREIEQRKWIQEDLEREREEQKLLIRKLEDAHGQLLQSEKLASVGQLAAGVAHEINNPVGFVTSNLGALRNYVEQLLSVLAAYEALEPLLAPELRVRLAEVRQQADLDYVRGDIGVLLAESIEGTSRVRQIVQDLRDFSRVGETEWHEADINAGIDSTLNVVRNELKYKAEVTRDYGQLPPVLCLQSQLNQVFMNLLVNAAQSIPERGTIAIRTGCEGDEVWVAISDTGVGMPPEIVARIFDPFFTTKPVGKGTGLGLAVSYGIVEKHKGRIEVQSTPGVGSTFTVRLPVRQESPPEAGGTQIPAYHS
jgi:two-component system NtrC family sensor kinase